MRRLVICAPGQAEQRLDVDEECSLGSGEGDVLLPALPRRALVVAPAPDGIVVEALLAFTVGDRSVPTGCRRLLRFGEHASIAGCELWLECSSFSEDECTRVLAGAILAGAAAAPVGGPTLLVVQGPDAGRRLAITSGDVIGRGASADLALGDPLVSRRHVRLEIRDGELVAHDLGSKNGFTVNGRRASRARRRRRGRDASATIDTGDEVRLGETLLVYEDGSPLPVRTAQPESPLSHAIEAPASAPATSRARIAAVAFASSALLVLAGILAHAAG